MADRILAIEAEARDLARHDALPPMGDRLTAIIESRMSQELAWLRDDGKTVEMWDPEHIGWGLAHLYLTGDVVSGLPPLEAEAAAGTALDVERLARALLACNWMLDLGDGVDADQYRGEEAQRIAAEYARLAAATAEPKG